MPVPVLVLVLVLERGVEPRAVDCWLLNVGISKRKSLLCQDKDHRSRRD